MSKSSTLTRVQFESYLDEYEIAYREYLKVIDIHSRVLPTEKRVSAINDIIEKEQYYKERKQMLEIHVLAIIHDSKVHD